MKLSTAAIAQWQASVDDMLTEMQSVKCIGYDEHDEIVYMGYHDLKFQGDTFILSSFDNVSPKGITFHRLEIVLLSNPDISFDVNLDTVIPIR